MLLYPNITLCHQHKRTEAHFFTLLSPTQSKFRKQKHHFSEGFTLAGLVVTLSLRAQPRVRRPIVPATLLPSLIQKVFASVTLLYFDKSVVFSSLAAITPVSLNHVCTQKAERCQTQQMFVDRITRCVQVLSVQRKLQPRKQYRFFLYICIHQQMKVFN